MDEEGLRRVRHSQEIRKRGGGDDDELPVQPTDRNDENGLKGWVSEVGHGTEAIIKY